MVAVGKREHQHDGDVDRDAILGVHFVTADEGRVLFDRQAWKLLRISGTEFLRRWDAGEYRPIPDTLEGRKIGRLVMLMPFGRRTNT